MHNYFHFKDLENNTSYHQSKKEKKKPWDLECSQDLLLAHSYYNTRIQLWNFKFSMFHHWAMIGISASILSLSVCDHY